MHYGIRMDGMNCPDGVGIFHSERILQPTQRNKTEFQRAGK